MHRCASTISSTVKVLPTWTRNRETYRRSPGDPAAAVRDEALRQRAEARENDDRRCLLLDCLEAYAALDEAPAEGFLALWSQLTITGRGCKLLGCVGGAIARFEQ
jgi:hypothetical protein